MSELINNDAGRAAYKPGVLLKQARELRGLTPAQVAAELRLALRFVLAMEADAYKDLPEPAFVRGYLRRYAQFLKLSADDIVAKFNECYAADGETPAPDAPSRNPLQLLGNIKAPRFRVGRLLSWASFALFAFLIAGALFWNHSPRRASAEIEAGSSAMVEANTPVTVIAPAAVIAPATATTTVSAAVTPPAVATATTTTMPAQVTSSVVGSVAAAPAKVPANTPASASAVVTMLPAPSGPALLTLPGSAVRVPALAPASSVSAHAPAPAPHTAATPTPASIPAPTNALPVAPKPAAPAAPTAVRR